MHSIKFVIMGKHYLKICLFLIGLVKKCYIITCVMELELLTTELLSLK
jgi:hypothetical protein